MPFLFKSDAIFSLAGVGGRRDAAALGPQAGLIYRLLRRDQGSFAWWEIHSQRKISLRTSCALLQVLCSRHETVHFKWSHNMNHVSAAAIGRQRPSYWFDSLSCGKYVVICFAGVCIWSTRCVRVTWCDHQVLSVYCVYPLCLVPSQFILRTTHTYA